MILQLSHRYSKTIAACLLSVFYLSIVLPAMAVTEARLPSNVDPGKYPFNKWLNRDISTPHGHFSRDRVAAAVRRSKRKEKAVAGARYIGGPSQPEMSSFKSVGTNNMVNLFTGDFNYNIPLMDVGGYPVNIYYDGGIGPDQEASWVGLGWNINPGNINRNVRGVPDDFNGQDTLQQMQTMKPNKTWGLGIGADFEFMGIKPININANLGVAFNNYLGPSLDLALRGNTAFKIGNIAGSEKISASAGLNIGIDINSRAGTSFSGGVSLTASALLKYNTATFGAGLSTGYNSRSGIKSLQISEQSSFSANQKHIYELKGDAFLTHNTGGKINGSLY